MFQEEKELHFNSLAMLLIVTPQQAGESPVEEWSDKEVKGTWLTWS